ncbi:MAG: GNAT family N-acetyltransferase [Gemmatimonadales bacterium]
MGAGRRPARRLTFSDAGLADAKAIAALRNEAARDLTARFGQGHWSLRTSEQSVRSTLRHARIRIGRTGRRIVTVLTLARRKPWAIDVKYFTPVERPLYLAGMAVSVDQQGRGLGRQALKDALRVARAWPADAIRLDAYVAKVGAGGFYTKCGYARRGRKRCWGLPLLYYELLIS